MTQNHFSDHYAKYGKTERAISYRKAYRETPKGKYVDQRQSASYRGIPWEFTFETWWKMWEPHWDKRGPGGKRLMMCRNGDEGPYSPENCRIDSGGNNTREYYRSKFTGVSWARREKKWRAYINVNGDRTELGWFSDRFDAICARKSAENSLS